MSGHESVEMYGKGGRRPIRFYMGALCAFDVIAASDGTVYIADACGGLYTRGRVLVYPPGKTKPSRSYYRWYSILPDARCEEQSLRRFRLGGQLCGPGKALSARREGWRRLDSTQYRPLSYQRSGGCTARFW